MGYCLQVEAMKVTLNILNSPVLDEYKAEYVSP